MGNKEAKQVNAGMKQEQNRTLGENQQFQSTYGPERAQQQQWATGAQNDIYGGYKNMLDPKFLDQFGFGSGTGGAVAPRLQAAKLNLDPRYQNLESKYFDPLAGSILDAQKGYNEFANTGGYSAADIGNLRSRGNSVIPSFYENLRNRMSQQQNAAGLNAGSLYSAASGRMARQQAQGAQQAALETETGLQDRIRQGKQWGIEGQSQLGGMGLSGLGQVAGESQRIADFNEQERANIANQQAQANASAANSNSANARALAEDRMRAYGMGLGGMLDTYTSSPSELARYDELMMGNRNMVGNQQAGMLGQRASYNPNVSWWDRAMQGIGAGAGLIGAF